MDPPRIERGAHPCKGRVLPLDYGPNSNFTPYLFLIFSLNKMVCKSNLIIIIIFLGGDPSAGSPTDTLCRLNLPCLLKILLRKVSS
jgi:hypothetical protein